MCALDGTEQKRMLGANAILAVSMAACRCAANVKGIPLYRYLADLAGTKELVLPVPYSNVINGGKHAKGGLALQELMIVPTGASSFHEAVQMVSEVYHALKSLIDETFKGSILVGDEGGFAPPFKDADQALTMMQEAVASCGYTGKVNFAIDAAASEFRGDGIYHLHDDMDRHHLLDYYLDLLSRYPIVSLEDPFSEDDFDGFKEITEKVDVPIIGDDLLVTNTERMEVAYKNKLCDSLLLKVNQIGTVTESIDAALLAKKYGWGVMVSHRSGETEDTFIADLSVALGCGQIKLGAPARGERTAKYNALMRIEEKEKFQYSTMR